MAEKDKKAKKAKKDDRGKKNQETHVELIQLQGRVTQRKRIADFAEGVKALEEVRKVEKRQGQKDRGYGNRKDETP